MTTAKDERKDGGAALVATDAKADPGYRDGHTWTLSFDPDVAGWHHDGGYAGYGLPEALAKEIAARYNAHERLRSALEKCEGALKKARQPHYTCEDGWYSCPKSPDGCLNENAGTACTCSAETVNAEIDAALAAAEEARGK